MAHFEYKARDATGRMLNGRTEADNASVVAGQLAATGVVPLDIREVRVAGASLLAKLDFGKVGMDELIVLSRQLHSLTKAGIPVTRAVRGLAQSVTNPKLQRTLEDLLDSLESGLDLATAMSRHPKVFSELYIAVVHVGENTGRLDEAFKRMAAYLELERETIKRVKSATRYPMFVVIAMGIALTIVNIFVIPAFAGVFAKFDADLPWQTQALLATSDFFVNWWYLLLAGIVVLWFAAKRAVAHPEGRHAWDKRKLHLPVMGGLYERINLGRFCQTFAMALRSGVPVVQALNVVSRAIGNEYMARKVREMRSGLERGESVHRTAVASDMFTPIVLQMIAVGEETGQMEDLLTQAAEFYEEEVDYQLKGLTDAIEPILIIMIGGLVLVLALGVFLPLWELSGVATR